MLAFKSTLAGAVMFISDYLHFPETLFHIRDAFKYYQILFPILTYSLTILNIDLSVTWAIYQPSVKPGLSHKESGRQPPVLPMLAR